MCSQEKSRRHATAAVCGRAESAVRSFLFIIRFWESHLGGQHKNRKFQTANPAAFRVDSNCVWNWACLRNVRVWEKSIIFEMEANHATRKSLDHVITVIPIISSSSDVRLNAETRSNFKQKRNAVDVEVKSNDTQIVRCFSDFPIIVEIGC